MPKNPTANPELVAPLLGMNGKNIEFHVENAAAAVDKCWELVRQGQADLFRGQTRDWPKLIPGLFRSSDKARTSAIEELKYFKDWSSNVPQMGIYGGDDTSITAIAQHYGISTAFLDITTNPEIAVLFASTLEVDETAAEAVIYCFLEADLKLRQGISVTRINVDNLWRLEAQSGLFLNCLDEAVWEIERVIEQSKWIVEVGGISALELSPTMTSPPKDEIDRAFRGVGAFEVWLFSKQLMGSTKGKTPESIKPIIEQFWSELMISNGTLNKHALKSLDWPGPVSHL